MFAAAIFFTLAPPQFRPTTGLRHWLEHAIFFGILGSLFSLSFPGRALILSAAAFATTMILEILQLHVPGRHARLTDFLVDTASALVGIFCMSLISSNRSD
jgi:VanZ family protein